jgi:acyl dehydratase
MTAALTVDELQTKVGGPLGISSWVTLDQAMISNFGETTRDTYFIHMDPERAARETPFGGTIAHGFLTLSLLSGFAFEAVPPVAGAKTQLNYGLERVRFIAPVKTGKRVRGRFALKALDLSKPGRVQSTYGVTVEIEGEDKPALTCDWIALVFI